MSLINDALNDLERRDSSTFSARHNSTEAGSSSAENTTSNLPTQRQFLAGVLLGGGLTFLCAYFLFSKPGSDDPAVMDSLLAKHSNVIEVTESIDTESPVANPLSSPGTQEEISQKYDLRKKSGIQKLESHQLAVINENRPISSPKLAEVEAINIADLLAAADRALTSNALTTPENNNAVYYFNKVLSVAPENTKANDGLQRVKARYMKIIESAYDKGDRPQAERLSERLLTLLTDKESESFKSRLTRLSKHNNGAVADQAIRSEGIHILPSPSQVEADIKQQYYQLMDEGKKHQAQMLLERHVLASPSTKALAALLLGHYLDTQQLSNAKELLMQRQGLGEFWPYQQALLIQKQSGDGAALAYLSELYSQKKLSDEKSLALLAGLDNKQKHYASSATVYRQLISMNESDSRYWLGLAIAEEALQNYRESYQAYRVAAQHGSSNQQVQAFIRQRLESLRAKVNTDLELTQW